MKTHVKLISLMFMASITIISCGVDDLFNPEEEEEEVLQDYNLDALQGTWKRVGGNNVNNEGMTAIVANNTGKIIDPVKSGFKKDDMKWKEIQPEDSKNYNYFELGSDLNYYYGTMEFGVDDTLRIAISSAGAGNIQKWVHQ